MRLSLTEARRSLLSSLRPLPAETASLAEAAGRIVREAAAACIRLPPADCAAVDGYAVRLADLPGSGGTTLRLAGTVAAGRSLPPVLPTGSCVAVMTGAPLPLGTDAVVPYEAAARHEDAVAIPAVPVAGSGIRRAGDEARPGEVVAPSGAPVEPRMLERLAGQGITLLTVVRRARVSLIATGDELIPPGEALLPGQRVASNLSMLEALVHVCGGQVERSQVAPDDPERLREILAPALTSDLVLTTGGTLRGTRDLTKTVLADLGAVFHFDGVAMRPGSSCAAATGGQATILCLPGSPGAAFLGFAALGQPLLRALHGWGQPVPAFTARLGEPLPAAREETLLVSGVVADTGAGPEFRRRGQGWPALGILAPLADGSGGPPHITVEPLPLG